MRNLEAQEVKGISGGDLAYRDPKLRNMTATELVQLLAAIKVGSRGMQFGHSHCPSYLQGPAGMGSSAMSALSGAFFAGVAMGAVRSSFSYAVPTIASAFPGSVSE